MAAGLSTTLPAFDRVRGLSLDILTAARSRLFGPTHPPDLRTVVVALDEETFRTPPFARTPGVTWTREIGRVLTAIIEGGATVVGFDIIYPTSIEQSEIPFGDETIGARLRGFDRDYLRALALASRSGKVVLGQVQLGDEPIRPSPGQRIAVGHQRNIRPLNVTSDPDGVVRRIPLTYMIDGETQPSMAVELAARAVRSAPEIGPDGRVTLAGYRVPGVKPNTITINFTAVDDTPTYSLSDLSACVAKGDTAFFRREFEGRIVIFGTLLDAEDRKITAKRFAATPERARAARCALAQPSGGIEIVRSAMSGVYVHAAAVSNLLQRNAITELPPAGVGAAAIVFSALAAGAAFVFAPLGAALAYGAGVVVWSAGALVAFGHAFALPLVEPFFAGLLATVVTIAYRFVVSDKDKRFLRKSFALYLAPAVVEKIVSSNKPPELGGETRLVTVYFSDLAGFSTLSEKLTPVEIVKLMNAYFSEMNDVIEEHGGFVYQFLGDAIVAVFGAPLDAPDHAAQAVRAALRCSRRLDEINRAGTLLMGHRISQRIGVNSGEVLIGNIGARRRFNYTAIGDVVNVASRLEGANKYFATGILASDATVALTGAALVWREVDAIRVKGRDTPVKIYEPLAEAGQATPEQSARAAIYAEALGRWRAGAFADAARALAGSADSDPPAAALAARASKFAANPPGPDWEPVTRLEDK
jgi:adenylate cyclase